MAAGDRKVKIMRLLIHRANPVICEAHWRYEVESGGSGDLLVRQGAFNFSLGTPSQARPMTLEEIEDEAITQVTNSSQTPPRESVT